MIVGNFQGGGSMASQGGPLVPHPLNKSLHHESQYSCQDKEWMIVHFGGEN